MKKGNSDTTRIHTTLGRNSIDINIDYYFVDQGPDKKSTTMRLNTNITISKGAFPAKAFSDMPPRILKSMINKLGQFKKSPMINLIAYAKREIEILFLEKVHAL